MKLFPDDHETISGTARRLRQGETTCVDVVQSCLERIEQREHEVRAWVIVDRDGALAQAVMLRRRAPSRTRPRAAARDSDRGQGHH